MNEAPSSPSSPPPPSPRSPGENRSPPQYTRGNFQLFLAAAPNVLPFVASLFLESRKLTSQV